MDEPNENQIDKDSAKNVVIPLKSGNSEQIGLFVGIGASAGGLEAIQQFFEKMPPYSSLAFIVIQHLSPDYKSMMVELLSKKTKIPVKRAEDGMQIHANTIYLIPPKKNLRIFHGKLLLSDQDHSRGINLPIDIFLNSLAEDQGERAAGVILSGTGSDGMRGIRAIKEQGGLVMVQTETSAKFDGMPRAAISTGFADFILSPADMPDQLISYVKHPYMTKGERKPSIIEDESGLTRIFSMLRERFKNDFTFYKQSTVARRIERRMTVNQIVDINDYATFAKNTPSEIATLYHELLIGVTSFFRDSDAFKMLLEKWLPKILDDDDRHEFRFWVAGCATGEEAYSIAITARECMERLGISKDIKIFATDIHKMAIAKAGAGIYPESIAADISTTLLTKYFYRKDENFQINRNIREMVVFAQHNLIKDPPFTSVDLIACRNLLIYLQPVLQRKVMGFFNFSLRPGGLLMLGLSETVGELGDLFELVDGKNKIYRSKGKFNALMAPEDRLASGVRRFIDAPQRLLGSGHHKRISDGEHTLQRFVDALSGDYIPLSIIVNEQLELQHIVGDTSGLFRLPSGRPVNDVSKMVAKELAIPLATGVQKVFRSNKPHVFSNIRVQSQTAPVTLKMAIRPLPDKRGLDRLVGVLIEEMAPPPKMEDGPNASIYDLGNEAEQYIRDMENELQFTRENLQATIEELETANEELQATNEELLASNEELQSTNEELQSTNEELHTVNVEYQNKIIELTELNNDVDNLLTSSLVGKLLLDENLEIRRFSTLVKTIFKVLESDIGRPLTHITHRLVGENPLQDVKEVIKTGKIIEKEVRTQDDKWYFMRVLPYQIGPDAYSGAVLSFMDITELKSSKGTLATQKRKLQDAQEIALMGNWNLDLINDQLTCSDRCHEIFELEPESFSGTYDAFLEIVHPDDRDTLDALIKQSVKDKMPYTIVHRLLMKDGRIKHVNEICRTEYNEDGKPVRSVGIVQDVTRQKHLEAKVEASQACYRLLFDAINTGVAVFKALAAGDDFEFVDINKFAEDIEQIKKEDIIGKRLCDVIPDAKASGLLDVMQHVWRTGRPEHHPASFYKNDRIAGYRENQVYKLPSGEVVTIFSVKTANK
jgi:two-component system CheB/CheR fusion protein